MPSSACSGLLPLTSPLLPYTTLFRSVLSPIAKAIPSAKTSEDTGLVFTLSMPNLDKTVLTYPLNIKKSEPFCGFVQLSANRFPVTNIDRKSTRLNSSHLVISYAVFCLQWPPTTHISTLALHDALPICVVADSQSYTFCKNIRRHRFGLHIIHA